jgi:hypothetical protein
MIFFEIIRAENDEGKERPSPKSCIGRNFYEHP